MTADTQILQLRRKITGLSLQALAQRADLAYQRTWRILSGGAKATVVEAAALDNALAGAEAELRDAVSALAVLRSSFGA